MRKLPKIIFTICFLLGLFNSYQGHAQREKIEVLRHSYISKKLELSTTESEKFWPVYNEYQDKLKALKRNLRQAYKNLPANFTDKEAEDLINLENKTKLAEAELFKTYSDKIKAIIGINKLLKLQVYEEEFKKEVINALKEK